MQNNPDVSFTVFHKPGSFLRAQLSVEIAFEVEDCSLLPNQSDFDSNVRIERVKTGAMLSIEDSVNGPLISTAHNFSLFTTYSYGLVTPMCQYPSSVFIANVAGTVFQLASVFQVSTYCLTYHSRLFINTWNQISTH